jgi:hypothetical protein
MEPGNTRKVYVVQYDANKDLSDAKNYGALKAVFGNPRKPYNTDAMLAKARRELADYEPGDYLLMIGDPTLCAICMSIVVGEFDGVVNVLSWDRNTFQYIPQRWNFDSDAEDFVMADD